MNEEWFTKDEFMGMMPLMEWTEPTKPQRRPISASEQAKRKASRKQAAKSRRRNRQ